MTTRAYAPSPSWDLESLFPGGSAGSAVTGRIDHLKTALGCLLDTFTSLSALSGVQAWIPAFSKALVDLEKATDEFNDLEGFASCAAASNTDDAKAKELLGICTELDSIRARIQVLIQASLADISEYTFEQLMALPELDHMRFYLTQSKQQAEIMMKPELEGLQEELARDGLHAWNHLYDTVSGNLRVVVDRGQGPEPLSVQQARNLLDSTDADFRGRVAQALHQAWSSEEEVFAATLNHINGFRQVVYGRRGIDELEMPLRLNRMSREALEVMMTAVGSFAPTMKRYLEAKARRLGLEKLRWFDVNVPLGSLTEKISYEDAQQFIVRHFDGFSPDLGEFARLALSQRWIEAEDRAGKRHGGFCAGFPVARQSRIFMTYGATFESLLTLAHELGHAYHGWAMRDLPGFQRHYPAALAETASTFAESVVREAAYHEAHNPEVKLGMLDRKLADAVAMTMNLPARFHFEREMYRQRLAGELSPRQLSDLVCEVFERTYASALSEHERLFWASKLHFHITTLPFYNFPYVVGYLFSLGLFARATEDGPRFADTYRDLLRLTGSHTVEDVAREALGVDLRQPDFWQSALRMIATDVDDFDALA